MDLCTEYIRRYPYFVSTSQWYSATKWTNHGQQSRVEAVFRHQPVPIRIKNVFALPCDAEFDYTPTYSYSLSLDKTDILEFLLTFLLPWSGELFASFFFSSSLPTTLLAFSSHQHLLPTRTERRASSDIVYRASRSAVYKTFANSSHNFPPPLVATLCASHQFARVETRSSFVFFFVCVSSIGHLGPRYRHCRAVSWL